MKMEQFKIVIFLTLSFPDLVSDSPKCLSYNSYDVSLENLVLDQLLIPTWYFAIFNLYGEILSQLFTGVKGKTNLHSCHKKKLNFLWSITSV